MPTVRILSALCLTLSGCGGPSQELIDKADEELAALGELKSDTEAGYGALEDDALFSRVTDAGQRLDGLMQTSQSGFPDMTDEDIEELWLAEAKELKETYGGLLELIEQTAAAEEAARTEAESRFEPVVIIMNQSGETIDDLTFETGKGGISAARLSLNSGIEDGAAIAGVSLPLRTDDMESELYLVCGTQSGTRRFFLGAVSGLDAKAINSITLMPEGEAQVTAE